MTASKEIETATLTVITVPATHTTVCCPPQNQSNWSLHPRVYLDISQHKQVSCPYCGQKFVIKN